MADGWFGDLYCLFLVKVLHADSLCLKNTKRLETLSFGNLFDGPKLPYFQVMSKTLKHK